MQRQGVVIPMVGNIFGRWVVLRWAGRKVRGAMVYLCQCTCPLQTLKEVSGSVLRSGDSQSCGCLKAELDSERMTRMNNARAHGPTDMTFWQQFVPSDSVENLAI